MKGKLLHQVKLKGKSSWLNRYCALLSKFKVATVSDYNEIGVFDVCNYSYTKRNITDIILTWTVHRNVLCVATDPLNNHILVGEVSRHVYVFDDQLNYHHTLTLPEMIIYPHHMTVSECNLLVCDYEGNKTYLVNMEEPESKLIRELPTPDFDGHSGNPMNVCTDSNGFIYVLWMKSTHFTDGKHVITQYTKDGCQLLATIPIGTNDARCITTIMIGMTEKLLVSTFESGKLYIYNLM
ncbi:hypothetical protein HOLleu_17349 [Holothuria leucospilota]|uniref:Uncharacterized protein n=1 Tax=Holothuria leucospilota TaxID=206669 RepID=A0A9Q1HB42_HOLLE|nr:hypothetical protein HOLleu_17349 [Holothuria leucospilota]